MIIVGPAKAPGRNERTNQSTFDSDSCRVIRSRLLVNRYRKSFPPPAGIYDCKRVYMFACGSDVGIGFSQEVGTRRSP